MFLSNINQMIQCFDIYLKKIQFNNVIASELDKSKGITF